MMELGIPNIKNIKSKINLILTITGKAELLKTNMGTTIAILHS